MCCPSCGGHVDLSASPVGPFQENLESVGHPTQRKPQSVVSRDKRSIGQTAISLNKHQVFRMPSVLSPLSQGCNRVLFPPSVRCYFALLEIPKVKGITKHKM